MFFMTENETLIKIILRVLSIITERTSSHSNVCNPEKLGIFAKRE